jgi:hypothetical protein
MALECWTTRPVPRGILEVALGYGGDEVHNGLRYIWFGVEEVGITPRLFGNDGTDCPHRWCDNFYNKDPSRSN